MGIQINGQTDTISAVDNNFSLAGNVSIGGTLTYEDVTSVDAVGLSTFQAGIQLDDSITHLGDTDTKIRFPAVNTVTVETAGSERLRIDSNGYVDIQTGILGDNPSDNFTLNGRTQPHYGFNLVPETGVPIGIAGYRGIAFASSGTERMRISEGGSVGIGTNNPAHKLDVRGTGVVANIKSTNNNYALQFAGNNCAYDVYVGSDNTNNFLLANENNNGTFTERLRITSGGNIGVGGLTTPGALLSIPAGESNTPRFAIESAVDDNDFTITQYEDGNGTYTMLGQNVKLNSSGNVTVLDSGHRTAGMQLDARNHGAITFITGAANAATERLHLNSDGKLILSGTARTTPFIVGDGGMCIEQSYDGLLKALSLRNKDTDAAAATALSFSLNRSGGDQDFAAGEIKLVKEQAWTTTSSTVDGAMVFSTISNGTLGEKLRITSDGTLFLHDGNPSQALNSNTKLEVRGPAIGVGGVDVDYFKGFKIALDDATEWGGQAQHSVGRYEESGSSARTSYMISLGHGGLNSSSNADVNVMEMRSNGCVMTPGQPTFNAKLSTHTSAGFTGILVFNAVDYNIGSHYNGSNGRFTAPVNGRYLFSWYTNVERTGGSGSVWGDWYVNGSGRNNRFYTYYSGAWELLGGTIILNLNANDYVQVFVGVGGKYDGSSYGSFSGTLLG